MTPDLYEAIKYAADSVKRFSFIAQGYRIINKRGRNKIINIYKDK